MKPLKKPGLKLIKVLKKLIHMQFLYYPQILVFKGRLSNAHTFSFLFQGSGVTEAGQGYE